MIFNLNYKENICSQFSSSFIWKTVGFCILIVVKFYCDEESEVRNTANRNCFIRRQWELWVALAPLSHRVEDQ